MIKAIKESLSQIYSLTETSVKLNLRYKLRFAMYMISPIFTLIVPIIILGKFYEYNAQFGPWTKANYFVFIMMSYNILLLRGTMGYIPRRFLTDKYWKTIALYLLAPFKTYCILLGLVFSRLIIISIPFMLFFLFCYIYHPISFYTILFVFLLYFLLLLLFSGMGIVLGVFAISNENIWGVLNFFLHFFFWFSCLTFPYQIFPPIFQIIINLNPFYHIFNILRVAWIVNNPLYVIKLYFIEFLILLFPSIIFPIVGVFIFNRIYYKYGIRGY
ncbi:MAG: ABC transporter permease [Candidatus Hodarchaeota archaeon]